MTHMEVTLYHDSEMDAAARQTVLEPALLTPDVDPVATARLHLNHYWQWASIDFGHMEAEEVEPGVSISRFVRTDELGLRVGADWQDNG